MRKLLAVIIGILLHSAQSSAAVACTSDAIVAGIAATPDGGTLDVSAGSFTAAASIAIIGKGITISSVGCVITDNITNAGVFTTTVVTPQFTRITGFEFHQLANKTGLNSTVEIRGRSFNGFRVDHNTFDDLESRAIRVSSGVTSAYYGYELYGVIDHNTFLAPGVESGVQAIAVQGGPTYLTSTAGANRPFSRDLVMGDLNATYVEDNVFTYAESQDGVVEGYAGASIVMRYNTVTGPTQGCHGADSGNYRGTRRMEVYGNNFVSAADTTQRSFLCRAGTIMHWDNDFGTDYDAAKLNIDVYRADTSYSTWGGPATTIPPFAWDSQVMGAQGWPALDQPGHDFTEVLDGTSTPTGVYAWANLKGATQVDMSAATNHSAGTIFLHADRDFWNENDSFNGTSGIGTGTRAARPASTTNGVAYWATDQGGDWKTIPTGSANDGCLDVVRAGAWVNCEYIPGTYPNPLIPTTVPTITSITPSSGYQGDSVPITLAGTNMNGGSPVLSITGTGVTFTGTDCGSAIECTATAVITGPATVGGRAVTLTTAVGTSNSSTFTVNGLTLTDVSPPAGNRGVTLTGVTLTGTDLNAGSGDVSTTCTGVTINTVNVASATVATFNAVIAAGATLGACTMVFTNVNTSASIDFTVISATGPTISAISVASGYQGSVVHYTITGTNFDGGNAAVSVSGSGVSAVGTTVVSSTSITGQLTITATAAAGSRTITVTTDAGASNPGIEFTVVSTGNRTRAGLSMRGGH